jgi:ATP-dependent protease HslVU (ClpYQ) peptidase subunit
MGFFNAMSSINKINRLLKDLENQVTITQDQVASNAPVNTLRNSLNVHKRIHQELIDAFAGSSTARISMFKIFGDNMRMQDVLLFSKNVTMNLAAIIAQR